MFYSAKERFKSYYNNTAIPILMIAGKQDELFAYDKIEESYSLIRNKDKKLISLGDNTHISIIWNAGSYINLWLDGIVHTR